MDVQEAIDENSLISPVKVQSQTIVADQRQNFNNTIELKDTK